MRSSSSGVVSISSCAAAMAASAVLPKHENSDRDLAFTVMGVNFLSTVVMVLYPPLREMLGYDSAALSERSLAELTRGRLGQAPLASPRATPLSGHFVSFLIEA